jgi:AcrR family transcriptional regulator
VARKAVAQELSRERILGEARELITTNCYRALTMRSIAKAMGYSHGALYYHFKEKAELFYALIKEDFSLLLYRQRELIMKENVVSISLLHKLMMEFIRFGLENPNHYEIMFMINDPELLQYSRTEQAQCMDLFASIISKIMAEQSDGEAKKYTLPWNFFMSMHGFISYCIYYNQSFDEVRKLAEAHIQLICNGLGLELTGVRSKKSLISHESA